MPNFEQIYASILKRPEIPESDTNKNFKKYIEYNYVPKSKRDQTIQSIIISFVAKCLSVPTIQGLKTIVPPEYLDYVNKIEKLQPLHPHEFDTAYRAVICDEESLSFTVKTNQALSMLTNNDEVSFTRTLQFLRDAINTSYSALSISTSIDLKTMGESIQKDYLMAKSNLANAFNSGYPTIDEVTGGIKPGELVFVAAPPGYGKSTFVLNWAYNDVVFGGYNVAYVSLEMTIKQVTQIIHTIHATYPPLNVSNPIGYKEYREGKLTPEQESFMFDTVIPDFEKNPEYGNFHIISLDAMNGSTIKTIEDVAVKLQHIELNFPIDILVVDYPRLLMPSQSKLKYNGDYGNLVIRELKQLAMSWGNSRGLSILAPHQINRQGEEVGNAQGGVYTTRCLADLNEVERSADIILTLWSDMDLRQKKRVRVGCLKNRDNPHIPLHDLYWDMPYRRILPANVVISDNNDTNAPSVLNLIDE